MRKIPLSLFALFLLFGVVTLAVQALPGDRTVANVPHLIECPINIDCVNTPTPHGQGAHSGDEDGDGIPDGIDQCPNQGGPSSNSGCPPGQQPVANPAPVVALPILPVNGDCVLATQGSEGVNIHIQPSTSAEIVGGLDPQTIYPVNGQHSDTDGIWDRIDDGWVARRVVRLGGNCDTLPEVIPQNTATIDLAIQPISCDVTELIDAINHAHNGDTINLAPGCIYTLTQIYTEFDNASCGESCGGIGLPFILKTLIINGNGATIRRSSAGGTPPITIFESSSKLTLNNLTLRNGKGAQDCSGLNFPGGNAACTEHPGAVWNYGGTMMLNNVTVLNNAGDSALFNDQNGTMTLNNVTVSNNRTNNGAVDNRGPLTVSDSTFSGNNAVYDGIAIDYDAVYGGGAIYNDKSLTVSDSTFSGNNASGFPNGGKGQGGAIYNDGSLTVSGSTFSGNNASGTPGDVGNGNSRGIGYGGGIYNGKYGTLAVTGSTFSDNVADEGGGLDNDGTASASNSTFFFNTGTTRGGAIATGDLLTLTNSTVVSNSAGMGGGIDNFGSGSALLGSSIVYGDDGSNRDLHGHFKSLGYNVIGDTSGATITGDSTDNLTNTASSPLYLGALTSNGGSTQTLSIGSGSVAIGAGNCATLSGIPPVSTDQRGSPRKAICDIGAYET